MSQKLLLYDEKCSLCAGLSRKVEIYSKGAVKRTPLSSEEAKELLSKAYGATYPDSFFVVSRDNDVVSARHGLSAALSIGRSVGLRNSYRLLRSYYTVGAKLTNQKSGGCCGAKKQPVSGRRQFITKMGLAGAVGAFFLMSGGALGKAVGKTQTSSSGGSSDPQGNKVTVTVNHVAIADQTNGSWPVDITSYTTMLNFLPPPPTSGSTGSYRSSPLASQTVGERTLSVYSIAYTGQGSAPSDSYTLIVYEVSDPAYDLMIATKVNDSLSKQTVTMINYTPTVAPQILQGDCVILHPSAGSTMPLSDHYDGWTNAINSLIPLYTSSSDPNQQELGNIYSTVLSEIASMQQMLQNTPYASMPVTNGVGFVYDCEGEAIDCATCAACLGFCVGCGIECIFLDPACIECILEICGECYDYCNCCYEKM